MPRFVAKNAIPEGQPDDVADIDHDSVGSVRRLYERHGPMVAFTKSGKQTIFAFSEEANRQLLCQTEAFHVHSFLPGPRASAQRRLTNGLFSLNGAKHKQHRRAMMPSFRKETLPFREDILVRLADEIVASWPIGGAIDLVAEAKRMALRVTTRVLFGLNDFGHAHDVDRLFEEWLALNHMVSFGALLPIELPTNSYLQLLDCANDMERMIQALVQQRRVDRSNDGADLFTPLLHAADAGHLSEEELVGEATHLFNAAYHTTGYTLTWLLLLLAQHPATAQTLAQECRIERSFEENPTAFLERTIKEGMRILSAVVYLPRTAAENVEFLGCAFPRGTVFFGSHYVTHHLPELYANPERFDPDRWLTEKPGPFGYIPFGGGARMCVGAPFALLIQRIALTRILRRVRLTLVPGIAVTRRANLTLGPRDPIPATVWPADGQWTTQPIAGNIQECVHFPRPIPQRQAA